MIEERFELVTQRLDALSLSEEVEEKYVPYFEEIFGFVKKVRKTYEFVKSGKIKEASLEVLKEKNVALYQHFSFQLEGQMDSQMGNLTLFAMRRP